MKVKLSDILIWIGWAIMTAYIVLQALYQRLMEPLAALDIMLILGISVLAGLILVDPEIIVFGFVGSISTSMIIMYFCLTLPASLGQIRYAPLREILFGGALGIVVARTLIYLVVPCLLGSLLGGIVGERLGLRYKTSS